LGGAGARISHTRREVGLLDKVNNRKFEDVHYHVRCLSIFEEMGGRWEKMRDWMSGRWETRTEMEGGL
jgi:hypothetical protein